MCCILYSFMNQMLSENVCIPDSLVFTFLCKQRPNLSFPNAVQLKWRRKWLEEASRFSLVIWDQI